MREGRGAAGVGLGRRAVRRLRRKAGDIPTAWQRDTRRARVTGDQGSARIPAGTAFIGDSLFCRGAQCAPGSPDGNRRGLVRSAPPPGTAGRASAANVPAAHWRIAAFRVLARCSRRLRASLLSRYGTLAAGSLSPPAPGTNSRGSAPPWFAPIRSGLNSPARGLRASDQNSPWPTYSSTLSAVM